MNTAPGFVKLQKLSPTSKLHLLFTLKKNHSDIILFKKYMLFNNNVRSNFYALCAKFLR